MSENYQKSYSEKLRICKPPSETFLQVGMEDWQEAAMALSPAGFKLYLYLASNQNGYDWKFSPSAVEATGLMTRRTAQKARDELKEVGYIDDGVFYTRSLEKRKKKVEYKEKADKAVAQAKQSKSLFADLL